MLRTTAHACGYWPERVARNLVLDASVDPPREVYPALLATGFRRSGETVYRPRCDACTACVPVRIPVARFRADRAQRRCLARNADLAVAVEPARGDPGFIDLYRRYLEARHPGSGMGAGDTEDFASMFLASWTDTQCLVVRHDGRLLAVAITDVTVAGCSAVYTFFDPDERERRRGLGTFAILSQIALARELGLPHLYLGYWLDGHPNMHYKARFRPQQQLGPGGWMDVAG